MPGFAARVRDSLAVLWPGTLQRLARLLGARFPLALALVLSALAVADSVYQPFMRGLETRSYDFILRHRLLAAPADPDIVVIDIDEASLEALSEEYGRWPWPRAVLAELLEALEQQGARAVFFDILFADPDTQNRESDSLFNEAVARSRASYFAMLRLDPSRDAKSELHASQVPGAIRVTGAHGDPTVAMILPRFPAIIASARVGTVHADPDRDGVVRRLGLYEEAGAWRIPSVALKTAQGLGMPVPEERQIQLNWRGPPFTYRFVSFAEVHADALRKDKRRDPREFAGKIVLVGSTAPALFDLRATPMASVHPGVEILATGIDNLKHGDYYRPLGKYVSLAVSLALIWGLALGLRWLNRGALTGPVMLAVQVLLLLVAYVSLNVTHYYVDLVVPFTFGLAFFLLASLRADLRERAAQLGYAASLGLERGRRYRLLLLVLQPSGARLGARTRAWLIDRICVSRAGARWADPPYRGRGVLGADFEGLGIVYWLAPQSDPDSARAAGVEREAFARQVQELERHGVTIARHEASFEWSGERPGVVGGVLIDALRDMRRSKP
jgi:CHASE2 domain-containing sensor protein